MKKTNVRSDDQKLQLDLAPTGDKPQLKRSLGLPLAVLYGLGVTIGAGIYVLIGAAAGRAGMQAPLAFVLAAIVMAPSAGSFGELSARLPLSAGEAAYVREGLQSKWLATVVGFLVIAVAVISAAAISVGSAGYLRTFLEAPISTLVVAVVLTMGMIAAWGIVESVALAGLMTLIEVGGLVTIIAVGLVGLPDFASRLPEAWPAGQAQWAGVLGASLLAVFAFTGFESLANIAEEVKAPARTLPRAMFLTLLLTTLLYMLVVWVALVAVPPQELAASSAPLSLVFERVTGASPLAINAIAIVATVNGIIVFMVMGSRVVYGMADRGLLPSALAVVSPLTRTPLLATALVVGLVLILALIFPLAHLAEATSRLTLVIFALVNASLLALKVRKVPSPESAFRVPIWVPAAGLVSSLALLASDAAQQMGR
jgi:amino acid transporter